jgi:hypothetical protein
MMINTEELIDKNIAYWSKYSNKDKEYAKILIDYRDYVKGLLNHAVTDMYLYVNKHYIHKGLVECGVDGKELNVKNYI